MSPGIVSESDVSGARQSEYAFFNGERVARKDFPGNAVSYYFSDHLKTASVITDSTGHITDESDFYPWGGELQFANSGINHYKFTGKEWDAETGLDYFGARYYGNALGRFITPDWSATPVPVPYADLADPQSLNQTASDGAGARQGNGRSGRQARLKELGKDDKVSSADRGQIKRDENEIARGKRTNVRVPTGKELAHRRGKEAHRGYNYKHSDLQSKDLHRLQHKHEGYK